MNKKDIRVAKKKIMKCLTQDFKHGRKTNQAIFDKETGRQVFGGTDLNMVMNSIVLALYLTWIDNYDSNGNAQGDNDIPRRIKNGSIKSGTRDSKRRRD